jgi:hypothetical protein
VSLGSWCALRVELRDDVYLMRQDSRLGAMSSVQNHLGVFMGVSFLFPSLSAYGAP